MPGSVQTTPRQQGPSFLPQGLQSPPAPESQNSSRLAQPPSVVGRPLRQHGWSRLPQAHCPLLHLPNVLLELLTTHVAPSAMQRPSKQQPPPLQVLPAQHGVPGVPQVVQNPGSDVVDDGVEQTVPAPQRSAAFVPGQQISPAWPHAVQVPVRQANPAAHELPQQGWPAAPQAAQRPPAHAPPAPAHV